MLYRCLPALRQERPPPPLTGACGQLGPRGVEVPLGALGPGTQLTARLLEHLRAGFHRGAQFVAELGVPYKVILNNIDPWLGADEIRAAWGLLDGGGGARFRCAVRAYRAYSTAQANRQTVIQSRAGTPRTSGRTSSACIPSCCSTSAGSRPGRT